MSKTPYEKMQSFDPIIEKAYALKNAMTDAGQTILALHMEAMIGRILVEQNIAIMEWQKSSPIMSTRREV